MLACACAFVRACQGLCAWVKIQLCIHARVYTVRMCAYSWEWWCLVDCSSSLLSMHAVVSLLVWALACTTLFVDACTLRSIWVPWQATLLANSPTPVIEIPLWVKSEVDTSEPPPSASDTPGADSLMRHIKCVSTF